jgi:hypothetical protein
VFDAGSFFTGLKVPVPTAASADASSKATSPRLSKYQLLELVRDLHLVYPTFGDDPSYRDLLKYGRASWRLVAEGSKTFSERLWASGRRFLASTQAATVHLKPFLPWSSQWNLRGQLNNLTVGKWGSREWDLYPYEGKLGDEVSPLREAVMDARGLVSSLGMGYPPRCLCQYVAFGPFARTTLSTAVSVSKRRIERYIGHLGSRPLQPHYDPPMMLGTLNVFLVSPQIALPPFDPDGVNSNNSTTTVSLAVQLFEALAERHDGRRDLPREVNIQYELAGSMTAVALCGLVQRNTTVPEGLSDEEIEETLQARRKWEDEQLNALEKACVRAFASRGETGLGDRIKLFWKEVHGVCAGCGSV